jgi:hypothetical protein
MESEGPEDCPTARKLRNDVADPIALESRTDTIASKLAAPNILHPDPNLVKDLELVVDVNATKSKIEIPLPRREIPYVEKLLPSLVELLIDTDEERLTRSNTDSIDDTFAIP